MTASYLSTHQPIKFESISYVTQPLRSNYFTPKILDFILLSFEMHLHLLQFS